MIPTSITNAEIVNILEEFYGIESCVEDIRSLGSCQDANYLITSKSAISKDTNEYYVFKIANSNTPVNSIRLQNTVMKQLHMMKTQLPVDIPRLISTIKQSELNCDEFTGPVYIQGQSYFIRLYSYVHGRILSDFSYLSHEDCIDYGIIIGKFDKIFSSLSVSNINPVISQQWDMKEACDTFYKYLTCLNESDKEDTTLVSSFDSMNKIIEKNKIYFKSQMIHGDLAPYNVIAICSVDGRPKITGIIDFGDVCTSWIVGNLAIAITPTLIQDNKACYLIAKDILSGYIKSNSMVKEEILSLWPLIVQRAIMLYICIKFETQSNPSNQYCIDELVRNEIVLQKVLTVPLYLVQVAFESIESVPSVYQSLLSINDFFGEITHQVLDLGVTSDLYENGDWLSETYIYDTINKQLELSDSVDCISIPYGKPLFARSSLRSTSRPNTISLSTTFYFKDAISNIVIAPFDGIGCILKSGDVILHDITDTFHYILRGHLECLLPIPNIGSFEIMRGMNLFKLVSPFNSCSIQRIPKGLVDSSLKVNNFNEYSFHFLPPQYCNELEYDYYSLVCPNPFYSYPSSVLSQSDSLQLRYQYLANVQQHYFRNPPLIQRGYKEFLYDCNGRAYLDMVNNVAIVGHSHPMLTETATKQLKLLNTNSRFIYDILGLFCEKIISKIPQSIVDEGKLNSVFLVNSGSEATDLALRISRSVASLRRNQSNPVVKHQTFRDVICLQGAYHGVTTASDEVSTTLNDNPHSLETRAPWIHLVAMPNEYRGKYSNCTDSTSKYIDEIRCKIDELNQKGCPPSAFICEPLSGNAGGVEIPQGYLQQVYDLIHAAGGLCICDEVQVGYGRLGNCFWGFEEHHIVPDIITMAKAAGNGFPFGVVITSKDIVKEFGDSEGSFFSSAGGSPLSCAIGLQVLKIIEEEKLQENALIVGQYLTQRLKCLKDKYPHSVGCIHGHGLYQGIEIVNDSISKDPGTLKAQYICDRLLELGVICHATGDYSNVLKVKPPLCFSIQDADYFVECLETALKIY